MPKKKLSKTAMMKLAYPYSWQKLLGPAFAKKAKSRKPRKPGKYAIGKRTDALNLGRRLPGAGWSNLRKS
jgi:hypothetical protein